MLLSLALEFVFLRCGTMLDTGFVIPVEAVRDETEVEECREVASFPSVSLRLSYAPLTGMHDNRGFGGLVCKNA